MGGYLKGDTAAMWECLQQEDAIISGALDFEDGVLKFNDNTVESIKVKIRLTRLEEVAETERLTGNRPCSCEEER